jgi:hypothetical protein
MCIKFWLSGHDSGALQAVHSEVPNSVCAYNPGCKRGVLHASSGSNADFLCNRGDCTTLNTSAAEILGQYVDKEDTAREYDRQATSLGMP